MASVGSGGASTKRTLSTPLLSFLCVVGGTGSLILAFCLIALPDTPLPVGWLLVSVLALAAGWFALKMPGVPVYLSISDTFHITSCLLFGPAPATLTIALDSLVMSVRRGNPTHQILFNATSCAISLWTAGQVFFWLSGTGPQLRVDAAPDAATMALVLAMAVVYFVCNSGLIAVAVALQQRASVVQIWRQHFAIVAFSHLAAGSASFVLLVLAARGQSDRTRRGSAATRHISTSDAIVGGSSRRRGDARGEGDEVAPVHRLRPCDGHRSQGRRDQRSHPSCPSLRDGARPRPRHHRSADAASD